MLDTGETTVGSSVGGHGRTQPSGLLGRLCRCRASVGGVCGAVSVREGKTEEVPEWQSEFGVTASVTHTHPSTVSVMPTQKVVSTPYKLIDADPHAFRVVSYMRPSDYAIWGGATAAAPAAMYLWGEYFEITRNTDRMTDHYVVCH